MIVVFYFVYQYWKTGHKFHDKLCWQIFQCNRCEFEFVNWMPKFWCFFTKRDFSTCYSWNAYYSILILSKFSFTLSLPYFIIWIIFSLCYFFWDCCKECYNHIGKCDSSSECIKRMIPGGKQGIKAERDNYCILKQACQVEETCK